jgi:hypothetical protein
LSLPDFCIAIFNRSIDLDFYEPNNRNQKNPLDGLKRVLNMLTLLNTFSARLRARRKMVMMQSCSVHNFKMRNKGKKIISRNP